MMLLTASVLTRLRQQYQERSARGSVHHYALGAGARRVVPQWTEATGLETG